MEYDYLHMKDHGRGPGTSRKLKVMVKLHMVSVDMIEIVKRNLVSLRLLYFLVYPTNLIHD